MIGCWGYSSGTGQIQPLLSWSLELNSGDWIINNQNHNEMLNCYCYRGSEVQASRKGEQETWRFGEVRVKRRVKEGMGHLAEGKLEDGREVK